MSFSCSQFDSANNWCLRLKVECAPGRPGCILKGKVVFARDANTVQGIVSDVENGTSPMRLHYLQHVPFEGLAYIEQWAAKQNIQVSRTRLFKGEALPKLDSLNFLVVVGGPMSVNDEKEYSWLTGEKRFIEKAITKEIPVLGICLGAQLIASVLGAKVYRNKEKEIGWFPIRLTNAGQKSSLGVLGGRPVVFHWHGETFDLPKGAVRLAQSEACKNQAFQFGKSVIGLQFHLEMTSKSITQIIRNCPRDITSGPYVQKAGQMKHLTTEFSKGLQSDIRAFLCHWIGGFYSLNKS